MLETAWEYWFHAEHAVERYLLTDDNVDIVDAMPWIICCAMFWTVSTRYYQDESKYFVSSTHSVMLALAGITNILLGHNKFEHIAFYFMAGYFLADFFLNCLKREFFIYIIHHVITVGATYRMINGRNWNETLFASNCWLLELSTPFLNHYKVTRSAQSATVFALAFFLVRVLFLGRLSYMGWQVSVNRVEMGLIVMFTALNYYWFYEIVQMGLKQRRKASLALMQAQAIKHKQ